MIKSKSEISLILDKIYSLYPDNKTELNYSTPFQLLMSVVLSAQNTDKQVNKVTETFFKIVKNPEDIVKLEFSEIEKNLKSLNYYKHKSKFIKLCGEKLVNEFNSKIPDDLEKLLTFQGIGIKSAKVILGILYSAPYVGVDTHVHRVLNRIGIIKSKIPEQTDRFVEKLFTIEQKKKMHYSLVLFGRYICKAKKPKCETCLIDKECNYLKKL